ncbi:MAG TPA: hypothetical protein VGW33_01415 [Terriglobia bacterium]|nr:hypothetical protein [Terriglobia bacterium]
MTNEELERFQRIERTLEFIVGNQAHFDANQTRFDADMQQIKEIQRKTDERLDRVVVQHAALEGVVMTLAQSHVELINSHKRLAEAEAELKDRVDSFITFVEKYISSRNGGEQRPH